MIKGVNFIAKTNYSNFDWYKLLIPSPFLLYPIYVSQNFDLLGGPYYAYAVTGYFSHLVLDGKISLI